MQKIHKFISRLRRIGIDVELEANLPWVYLHKVNGNKILQKKYANHGFCIFMVPVFTKCDPWVVDLKEVFGLIRENLPQKERPNG